MTREERVVSPGTQELAGERFVYDDLGAGVDSDAIIDRQLGD